MLTSFHAPLENDSSAIERRFGKIDAFNGFVKDFNLQPKYAVTPTQFGIGNQFKSGLAEMKDLLGAGNGPHFSLESSVSSRPMNVVPSVHRYGSFYVPRIQYRGMFEASALSDVLPLYAELISWLAAEERVALLRRIASMASGVAEEGLSAVGKLRTHAELRIASVDNRPLSTEIAEWLVAERRMIVAAHISRSAKLVPDPRLERALLEHNSGLNLKSESQVLLVNAQGSILITAEKTRGERQQYHNRHRRVTDLSEVACAMQHMLLRAVRLSDVDASEWADDPKVVRRWVRFPRNVLHASVSNQRIWDVISESYALPSLLDELTELPED